MFIFFQLLVACRVINAINGIRISITSEDIKKWNVEGPQVLSVIFAPTKVIGNLIYKDTVWYTSKFQQKMCHNIVNVVPISRINNELQVNFVYFVFSSRFSSLPSLSHQKRTRNTRKIFSPPVLLVRRFYE